jgi:ABC-type sugar transport system ATPase subunit
MSEGKMEQVGNPETVYESPANVFVGGFIGSPAMAFGDFEVASDNGRVVLSNGELRVPVDARDRVPAKVTLGIRPEHVSLWRDNAGLVGPFTGPAEYVEALGRETFVGVRLSDDVRVVVQVIGRAHLEIGELVTCGLAPGQLYLFDANSGDAIGRC